MTSDRGTAAGDITEAEEALAAAQEAAQALTDALTQAHAATGHLGYTD